MLLELRIKVHTPFLGAQNSREGVRRFIKIGENDIQLGIDLWQYSFRQAAESLHLQHLDLDAVRLPIKMRRPTLGLFNRQYRSGKNGKLHIAPHECIHTGTELTIDLVLATKSAPDTDPMERPPTLDELREIFGLVGSHFGLSPHSAPRGFGRFAVIHLREKTKIESDNKEDTGRLSSAASNKRPDNSV